MSFVLSKLASITAIRDVELFELSVLKTLAEILKTSNISLYKFNSSNIPCRLLRYSTEKSQTNTQRRIDESHELHISDIDVPDHIKLAQQWIASTNKPYSIQKTDHYLTIYPVIGSTSIVGYVSIKMVHEPTETEKFAITSILKISHNFHSLLEENQKDKLTGLLNRKTFDDTINKIQSLLPYSPQAAEYNGKENRTTQLPDNFWLAVIDIDYFKKINDNFGHVYGDEVLLLVSQLMKQSFRNTDLLFRFGGEEFVVIVRGRNKKDAETILDRFRKMIAQYQFPQISQVTVSIGITQITEQFIIATDIVGRADMALYYAKENGRNQLFFYEDLLAAGKIKNTIEIGSIDFF
jgi:diguanylate cyclase (GGDEF)-like protein